MRVLAIVLVLLLLSGCAGSSAPSSKASSSSLATTSTAPTPKPVPPTDTLHFAVAPDMVLKAPKGSEPNQTELPASGFGGPGGGGGQTGAEWEYALASNMTFAAYEAHVFVRVVDQLVAPPDAATLCSWSLQVSVGGSGQGPPQVQYPSACTGPSGPTIAPGDYELVFTSSGPTQVTDVGPGDVMTLRVARTGTSPTPTTSVFVLTGAKDFDSRITFTGLKEPGA